MKYQCYERKVIQTFSSLGRLCLSLLDFLSLSLSLG